MLTHAETGLSVRLLRSSGASGRCRGLLQVLLENRTAATAGTSSKDADWPPDPTTRQSFLRLVLFHGRNSPLIRLLGRQCDGFAYDAPHHSECLSNPASIGIGSAALGCAPILHQSGAMPSPPAPIGGCHDQSRTYVEPTSRVATRPMGA